MLEVKITVASSKETVRPTLSVRTPSERMLRKMSNTEGSAFSTSSKRRVRARFFRIMLVRMPPAWKPS